TRMTCITEYAGLGIVLPVSDEGGLLYFVELVVFLFEFQFALAAFCDVAVLAEDHAVVRVHDAFKVIGSVTQCHFVIMDCTYLLRQYLLDHRIYLVVSGRWSTL